MVGPWGHGMMRGPGLLGGGLLALMSCVVFIAVAALLVWLIVRLVRGAGQPTGYIAPPVAPPPAMTADPVLEALRRRLAEGAITPEEFDQLREKLGV